ncbi:MAG: MBL fold metallo-hydrolase [Hydrogenothermaceae bacterium]|nr:MBL fold metallo-hydrolase [Hydrogenothermaceae bacterium]
MWLYIKGKNILVDPGPGSLIRIFEFKKDPRDLKGIILTHRHLDHVADVASVVESATESNTKKLDFLLAPYDAIDGEDPIVLKYTKKGFKHIWTTQLNQEYNYEGISIKALIKHIHQGAETYSLGIFYNNKKVVLVPCGRFYENMLHTYPENSDVMIFNTTFVKPNQHFYHLSAEDVEKIIMKAKPKKAVLTHYSLQMLKENPEKVAKLMSEKTGIEVIAAKDGLKVEF